MPPKKPSLNGSAHTPTFTSDEQDWLKLDPAWFLRFGWQSGLIREKIIPLIIGEYKEVRNATGNDYSAVANSKAEYAIKTAEISYDADQTTQNIMKLFKDGKNGKDGMDAISKRAEGSGRVAENPDTKKGRHKVHDR